jgi:hypothetical protein
MQSNAENPYAPPPADAADVSLEHEPPLFSPAAIATHTILFSPVFGGIMAAANWSRTGDKARARSTLALGIGATIVLMLLGAVAPDSIRPGLYGGTAALGFGWRREQSALVDPLFAKGRPRAAWWPYTLAGMAVLAAVVTALVSGAD